MNRKGFTLVEMLVVMGIMATMLSIATVAGNAIYQKMKVYNTESDITLLECAIQNYKDFFGLGDARYSRFPQEPYQYGDTITPENMSLFWLGHSVPATKKIFTQNHFDNSLWENHQNFNQMKCALANSEYLYFVLNDIPDSRRILRRLSNISNMDNDLVLFTFDTANTIDELQNSQYADRNMLYEILDSWNNPIIYHDLGKNQFPVIRSAGPDGIYYNEDDITSI